MITLRATPERMRGARPDSVKEIGQLLAGKIVVGFKAYRDWEGKVNAPRIPLAVVSGSAYRIADGQVTEQDLGRGLRKYVEVESLPSHTLVGTINKGPAWLCVEGKGIQGVDELDPSAGVGRGLLLVRDTPYENEPNLEIGSELYINGTDDYKTLDDREFMAVVLDSDPRLRD